MGWRDRLGLGRRIRTPRRAGRRTTTLDREASPDDIRALIEFAQSRTGVEFYVEPETFATDTTAVAVAADGEWTRRRVGAPEVIKKVAADLALPASDVQLTGYPQRMRDWNAKNKRPRL